MKKCPVCETELDENIPEFCDVCGWDTGEDLTLQPVLNKPSPEDIERYNKRLENAKRIWDKKNQEKLDLEKTMEEKIKEIEKTKSESAIPEGKLDKSNELKNDNMVFVEGGTFTMGDTFGKGIGDETPTHMVTLDSFYIGRYPVIQKEYLELTGEKPSNIDRPRNPVVMVTWFDAIMYANKLSEKSGIKPYYNIENIKVGSYKNSIQEAIVTIQGGKGYRLPTEAEWEYSARGGNKSEGFIYSGSNDIDRVCWVYGDDSRPVGQKKSNELGIYDMSGNVKEWCWDWQGPYTSSPKKNPTGPSSGMYRVLRGGSNGYSDYRLYTVFHRDGYNGRDIDYCVSVGFRLVRSC